MRLINLKRIDNYEVEKWLEDKIPELTTYQKERIRDDEIVRFAPFYFYKRRKKVNNVFIRLSAIFIIPVFLVLIIGLPFNFLITGNWGYSGLKWYSKWTNACGI